MVLKYYCNLLYLFSIDPAKRYKITQHLKVAGIKKSDFLGSFTVYLIVKDKRDPEPVWGIFDAKSILNRLERSNCLNCQAHEFAEVSFPFEPPKDQSLTDMTADDLRLYVASMSKENGMAKLTELDLNNLKNEGGCQFTIKVAEC